MSKSTHRLSVKFDVMLHDRFVCTLQMPITLDAIADYIGDEPVINSEAFVRNVEKVRTSLIGKPYRIAI